MTPATCFIFSFVLILVLVHVHPTHALCRTYIPAHEILANPSNFYAFDDDGGFREIRGDVYNVGNCTANSHVETGGVFVSNYTFIGHSDDVTSDNCLIKRQNGLSVYDSMQAIVITTNGWTFTPTIDLDDIDAEAGVATSDGWKESMAVFGLASDQVVLPNLQLHDSTLLQTSQYTVPAEATAAMGLTVGQVVATGSEYVSDQMVNCPFGRDNTESSQCRTTVSFTTHVDTVVIMYALAQKSNATADAAAFFSELVFQCGCRCRRVDVGARMLTELVSGAARECTRRETTGIKTECDLEGSYWCSREDKTEYLVSGADLSNGRVPCDTQIGAQVDVVGNFSPSADFINLNF